MDNIHCCEQAVAIRPVQPSDADAIASIYNNYVLNTAISFETEAVTVEEMRSRIMEISRKYPYFVAECDGKVAGYCYAHEWKSRPAYYRTWETTVYIDERIRHLHLGHRLMDKLVEECRGRECHALIACITGDNEASIAFHRSLGFEQVSLFKEVGFKFGRYLDVVDYELLL